MTEKKSKTVYGIITEQILGLLASGTIPWRKPWGVGDAVKQVNHLSRKPYRGINPFITGAKQSAKGYPTGEWLTYRQAEKLGGHVKKGEKGTIVVFWKFLQLTDKKTKKPITDENGKAKKTPLLRFYRVFNIAQCEGIETKWPPAKKAKKFDPIAACEKLIDEYLTNDGPTFSHDGVDGAYYQPLTDSIKVPKREAFDGVPEYYSTVFHELGHSTGHESRLKRKGVCDPIAFGSHKYSQEELVAEFTAAFLCGKVGIDNSVIENSAGYIQHWSEKLKEDERLIVFAAAQAQKAAERIAPSEDVEEKKAPTKKRVKKVEEKPEEAADVPSIQFNPCPCGCGVDASLCTNEKTEGQKELWPS